MPRKTRKTRKKRGSRTVGYGRVGQHRKTGQKGRRKAGRHKHLWSYVLRYEPDYFTKKGFHAPRKKCVNVLNVSDLNELATKLSTDKSLEERDGMAFLDLDKLGFSKLLGLGNLNKPFSVKVASYSESAAKKIKEAGGKLITEKVN